MASRCSVSPNMGLLEPQSPKPQPLRIIKRSQTVTGCCMSSPTFAESRGRISGSSTQGFDESFNVGSPPFGADRPLTVHKLRKKRASVLDGLADCSSDDHIAASTMISSSSGPSTPFLFQLLNKLQRLIDQSRILPPRMI